MAVPSDTALHRGCAYVVVAMDRFQHSAISRRIAEYSKALYEAATVDGAGAWAQFRKITLPYWRQPHFCHDYGCHPGRAEVLSR